MASLVVQSWNAGTNNRDAILREMGKVKSKQWEMKNKLGHANSFRDLEVYKQARELSRLIFKITATFPMEERYSQTDQIRRSSRSIGAQIAEAWGKRRYENHFILKLTDSDAEQYETQHWVEVSLECGYINKSTCDDFIIRCEAIGKMLNSMIGKSSLFCQKINPDETKL